MDSILRTNKLARDDGSELKADTLYKFFCRSRFQNLTGQSGASIAVVGMTWLMANQTMLLSYLIINQCLVLLSALSFYSGWTNRHRTEDGIPKFAIELSIIRQTFLGSIFWLDLQASQNLTFVLAVLVVMCACLVGSIVTLGPLKRLSTPSIICLFLPGALACVYVGHMAIGVAILFFIYVVALRGVRQVSLAYEELLRLRGESALTAASLKLNNRKLLMANQNLEDEMNRRALIEADREKLQEELVQASRQAGKAEVATGVLHNVGNVMNSVNVGTSILKEDLRNKLLSRLDASIDLLSSHEDDLADYFANNERAKHFLPFLRQLSKRTADMVDDVDTLLTNIGHVNEVVASQQSYATGALTVRDDPVAIVESALKITNERFRALQIEVITEFDKTGDLLLDRSRLLQVLVNVLKNAANSIADAGTDDRKVTVRIERLSDQFEISVTDTGVGIAADIKEKIFQHGFSTRADRGGHGFGLHHSANAITEMGGQLTVESPGSMQGATFSILLPLTEPEMASTESQPAFQVKSNL